MITNIIVAYDGSPESKKAFDYALDMAVRYSAGVMVISVAQPPEPAVSVEINAVLESATDYFEAQYGPLKDMAEKAGISIRFKVIVGHPAEQIVRMADETKSEAIVMGHRGESLLQKWLVGSVAKRVLSYAHCTVIVVR